MDNVFKLDPPNRKRIYYYPVEGKLVSVTVCDICELIVRPSGDHRLKSTDGTYHILPKGWLHIELDIDGWQC